MTGHVAWCSNGFEWQKRGKECESGERKSVCPMADQVGRVTYEYIKDVRFGEKNAWFDPSVYACFLMIGHGSMNAFLFERNLNESARCAYRTERED